MNKYSIVSQIMHKQFLSKGQLVDIFLDNIKNKAKNFNINVLNNIFITGLARSGSTALLESIDKTNQIGSLRYKYMPFILSPKLAIFYQRYFVKKNFEEFERFHGDGLKISLNSPECLDEPFWINSIYAKNNFYKLISPHDVSIELAREYGYLLDYFSKIENKKKLVIKNNNHHLRINTMAKLFPNSIFFILFRRPLAQAFSLWNQHKKFNEIQGNNPYILDYMNLIGHWEFGRGLKPFIYKKNQEDILKKYDPFFIEYWIQQWIFTHEWFLRNIQNKNVRFICYEELCQDFKYKNQVFDMISIKNNHFNFALGKSNFYDNFHIKKSMIDNAESIYNHLKDISINSFGI